MKRITVSLMTCLLFSVISHAQTIEYSQEELIESINSNVTTNSYWDDWQGHYNGTNFEMDYRFTAAGYFEYSITVYAGVFTTNAPGAYNELTVEITDEDENINYTDYSYPVGINAENMVKEGRFYVGTPSEAHSFLFNMGFLTSDKWGGAYGQAMVHW